MNEQEALFYKEWALSQEVMLAKISKLVGKKEGESVDEAVERKIRVLRKALRDNSGADFRAGIRQGQREERFQRSKCAKCSILPTSDMPGPSGVCCYTPRED